MAKQTWRDQYDRMHQSFELLKQIADPAATQQDVLSAPEVLDRFCCNAFHLRDYLTADLTTDPVSRKHLERQIDTDVIKPSEELSACRDVANRSKHLVLDGPTYLSSGKHAEVASHNIAVGVPVIRIKVTVTATATVIRPDGSVRDDAEPAVVQQHAAPEPRNETGSSDGYAVDTFYIEINGRIDDARSVGSKAIAAWDVWLKQQRMLCGTRSASRSATQRLS